MSDASAILNVREASVSLLLDCREYPSYGQAVPGRLDAFNKADSAFIWLVKLFVVLAALDNANLALVFVQPLAVGLHPPIFLVGAIELGKQPAAVHGCIHRLSSAIALAAIFGHH